MFLPRWGRVRMMGIVMAGMTKPHAVPGGGFSREDRRSIPGVVIETRRFHEDNGDGTNSGMGSAGAGGVAVPWAGTSTLRGGAAARPGIRRGTIRGRPELHRMAAR